MILQRTLHFWNIFVFIVISMFAVSSRALRCYSGSRSMTCSWDSRYCFVSGSVSGCARSCSGSEVCCSHDYCNDPNVYPTCYVGTSLLGSIKPTKCFGKRGACIMTENEFGQYYGCSNMCEYAGIYGNKNYCCDTFVDGNNCNPPPVLSCFVGSSVSNDIKIQNCSIDQPYCQTVATPQGSVHSCASYCVQSGTLDAITGSTATTCCTSNNCNSPSPHLSCYWGTKYFDTENEYIYSTRCTYENGKYCKTVLSKEERPSRFGKSRTVATYSCASECTPTNSADETTICCSTNHCNNHFDEIETSSGHAIVAYFSVALYALATLLLCL
uniref:Uncharacterized protein n=1 Tax=Palpitomonas bilix TaxID=652834 RepID=A0A7S3DHX5_9EUKA|mmetsp:Transcript_38181/g.98527  ORF Transcript_38181/g.98527 Transcript_38181/m.98527 type:complete len:327 (+) Transcript_38181:306-1286(+)